MNNDWKKQLDEKFNLWHRLSVENYNFVTCQVDVQAFIRSILSQQEAHTEAEKQKALFLQQSDLLSQLDANKAKFMGE
jgi:hypothetical protein